jgi:hypothetical protein
VALNGNAESEGLHRWHQLFQEAQKQGPAELVEPFEWGPPASSAEACDRGWCHRLPQAGVPTGPVLAGELCSEDPRVQRQLQSWAKGSSSPAPDFHQVHNLVGFVLRSHTAPKQRINSMNWGGCFQKVTTYGLVAVANTSVGITMFQTLFWALYIEESD